MQVYLHRLMAAMCLVCLALVATPALADVDSKQVLDHIDDLYRGKSAKGTMSMAVTTKHWKRTLRMRFWSLGKEHSLMRVLSPKKEKGTATLRVDKKVWNYLPKVRRVIKLPSSMMSASWMGSHFSNDDLVKESRMADDYTHRISFQGEKQGQKVIELELKPKPEAAVVWGKVMVRVRQEGYIPIKIDYYDEDLNLARSMRFEKMGDLGGRMVPTVLRMVPMDKPGEFTLVTYHEAAFDVGLKPGFFSLRTLQR